MMKIKVADLYDLSLGLNDLDDKEIPIETSLKVEQNIKNVSEELVPTDKVRHKIIENHKEQDFGGGMLKLDEDGNKKMNELMEQDVEIKLQKIKISELKGIKIKPRSVRFLGEILVKENAK